jgi:mRNA-degrading endonuclease RelE of RelBE toxin-antitoxin system
MGEVLEAIQATLQEDPLNLSRKHNIKKLTGVKDGEGRWRIRSGVYRLRYDVYDHKVVLPSINHRSQAY